MPVHRHVGPGILIGSHWPFQRYQIGDTISSGGSFPSPITVEAPDQYGYHNMVMAETTARNHEWLAKAYHIGGVISCTLHNEDDHGVWTPAGGADVAFDFDLQRNCPATTYWAQNCTMGGRSGGSEFERIETDVFIGYCIQAGDPVPYTCRLVIEMSTGLLEVGDGTYAKHLQVSADTDAGGVGSTLSTGPLVGVSSPAFYNNAHALGSVVPIRGPADNGSRGCTLAGLTCTIAVTENFPP